MYKGFLVIMLLLCCFVPMAVHAFEFDSGSTIKDALKLTDKDAKTTTVDIVRYAMSLLVLISVVFIIYGGIRYMTSAGNQDVIQHARAVLKWSIIGLAIILSSWAIFYSVVKTFKLV